MSASSRPAAGKQGAESACKEAQTSHGEQQSEAFDAASSSHHFKPRIALCCADLP